MKLKQELNIWWKIIVTVSFPKLDIRHVNCAVLSAITVILGDADLSNCGTNVGFIIPKYDATSGRRNEMQLVYVIFSITFSYCIMFDIN